MLNDFAAEYTSNVNFDQLKDPSGSISRTSSQATIIASESSWRIDASAEKRDGSRTMDAPVPVMRPQYLRAYRYWHEREMSLEKLCIELSLTGEGRGKG